MTEVQQSQMMSQMAGSTKMLAVDRTTGNIVQELALDVSVVSQRPGISVIRAGEQSEQVKSLWKGGGEYHSLRGQTNFATTLKFVSGGSTLDRNSEALMPQLKVEIQKEIDDMNILHKFCHSSQFPDRKSCGFIICTYVGSSEKLENEIRKTNEDGSPYASAYAGKPTRELTTARGGTITTALESLSSSATVGPTIEYGGVNRFAAVILKVYGSAAPPCEEADMTPLSYAEGKALDKAAAAKQKAAALEVIAEESERDGGNPEGSIPERSQRGGRSIPDRSQRGGGSVPPERSRRGGSVVPERSQRGGDLADGSSEDDGQVLDDEELDIFGWMGAPNAGSVTGIGGQKQSVEEKTIVPGDRPF